MVQKERVGRMNALAMWTPAFIIGYLLTLAVSITGSVMVGLAVYNDAKSKMSLNAVMWAMLVGILGWIPGIVYLCVRNKPLERIYACYSCGWGNPLSARQCRRCGAASRRARRADTAPRLCRDAGGGARCRRFRGVM